MQIMQLLQIVPQATPPNGTASEAPAAPAADSSLFAALFAGLVARPVEANAAAPLPETTPAAPSEEAKTGTTDEAGATQAALVAQAAQAPLVSPLVTLPSLPPPDGAPPVASAAPGTAIAAVAAAAAPKTEMPVSLAVPLALPEGEAKTAVPIPAPGPETASVQPRTPQPAPPSASAPPAGKTTPELKGDVEVLRVALDTSAPKTEGVGKQPELRTTESIPAHREAPVPAQQNVVRTPAAYPDRIPTPRGDDHPLRVTHAAPAESTEGEAPTAARDTVSGAGAKPREVEVIVKDEAGERQSAGNRDSGSRKEPVVAKDHAAPTLAPDGARGFESTSPTKAATPSEPSKALHDSVLAQVKEGIAAREGKGNGEITVRLNPQELGELRINVRVVDQHVKVEVLAASSQVRDILLNNLDSLKDNFSRQNLTMSGFDVSTGTGQGFDQFFREGREAGQGAYRSYFGGGQATDDTIVTAQASDYYYTDRRDNSLVDVRF
ncbi:flagellar hook-length control protein FliK [Geobacter sp.]|uniref:flagellar hook-length control protein FliK n=1 Tax=Geobacter sp. TaxID=46610 RepID=UPI002639D9A0|nr:flagellar hook-length control protein FliK [Geobacter sp.]